MPSSRAQGLLSPGVSQTQLSGELFRENQDLKEKVKDSPLPRCPCPPPPEVDTVMALAGVYAATAASRILGVPQGNISGMIVMM